jgi:hypothetical protein
MELLLNVVWLLAVGAGAYIGLRRRAERPGWQAVIAFACVALLIFPVISATDDLHPSFMIVEDATKRLARGPALFIHIAPAVALLAVLIFPASLQTVSRLRTPAAFAYSVHPGFGRAADGRAPPTGAA